MFLLLFVPVVVAFLLGQRAENRLNRKPRRAEKFILKLLADGKQHNASEVYNSASAVGIPYLAVYVAHGNLSNTTPQGNGKVKTIWRGEKQWLRLA